MKVLWERRKLPWEKCTRPGSDAERRTTVATMLRKMEARGLVKHRSEGRSFIYRPVVAAEAVTRSMADHFVDRLFEGSLTEVVSHLLTTREVSRDELVHLERLIAERKKAL